LQKLIKVQASFRLFHAMRINGGRNEHILKYLTLAFGKEGQYYTPSIYEIIGRSLSRYQFFYFTARRCVSQDITIGNPQLWEIL
jgi:hypothetical protein